MRKSSALVAAFHAVFAAAAADAQRAPFDAVRDFSPITQLTLSPSVRLARRRSKRNR